MMFRWHDQRQDSNCLDQMVVVKNFEVGPIDLVFEVTAEIVDDLLEVGIVGTVGSHSRNRDKQVENYRKSNCFEDYKADNIGWEHNKVVDNCKLVVDLAVDVLEMSGNHLRFVVVIGSKL